MKAVEPSSKICLSCCSPDRDKSKGFLACLERCMRVAAHLLAGFQVHASCCCASSRRGFRCMRACELLLLQAFRCMRAAVVHLLAGVQVHASCCAPSRRLSGAHAVGTSSDGAHRRQRSAQQQAQWPADPSEDPGPAPRHDCKSKACEMGLSCIQKPNAQVASAHDERACVASDVYVDNYMYCTTADEMVLQLSCTIEFLLTWQ